MDNTGQSPRSRIHQVAFGVSSVSNAPANGRLDLSIPQIDLRCCEICPGLCKPGTGAEFLGHSIVHVRGGHTFRTRGPQPRKALTGLAEACLGLGRNSPGGINPGLVRRLLDNIKKIAGMDIAPLLEPDLFQKALDPCPQIDHLYSLHMAHIFG